MCPGYRPDFPNNINFLTNLGHSVYMADLVEEAVKPDWLLPAEENEAPGYNVDGFIARHMDFGNREFDIVLLWDALDYIPSPLADAILRRLKFVMREHGQGLAFFHSRMTGPETVFCRYHVMDGDTVETQQGPAILCFGTIKIVRLKPCFRKWVHAVSCWRKITPAK